MFQPLRVSELPIAFAAPGLRTTSASKDAQPRALFFRGAPATSRSSAEAWKIWKRRTLIYFDVLNCFDKLRSNSTNVWLANFTVNFTVNFAVNFTVGLSSKSHWGYGMLWCFVQTRSTRTQRLLDFKESANEDKGSLDAGGSLNVVEPHLGVSAASQAPLRLRAE